VGGKKEPGKPARPCCLDEWIFQPSRLAPGDLENIRGDCTALDLAATLFRREKLRLSPLAFAAPWPGFVVASAKRCVARVHPSGFHTRAGLLLWAGPFLFPLPSLLAPGVRRTPLALGPPVQEHKNRSARLAFSRPLRRGRPSFFFFFFCEPWQRRGLDWRKPGSHFFCLCAFSFSARSTIPTLLIKIETRLAVLRAPDRCDGPW